jgi:hypothetical protein
MIKKRKFEKKVKDLVSEDDEDEDDDDDDNFNDVDHEDEGIKRVCNLFNNHSFTVYLFLCCFFNRGFRERFTTCLFF